MFIDYETFRTRADALRARIAAACARAGRAASDVQLLPVTKTHPAAAAEYALRYGFAAVGENRVQEGVEKRAQVAAPLRWELIGHLQSNKAKLAVAHFDRVQSVDSEKLLRTLNQAAAEADRRFPILLQVNAGNDPAKFGVAPGAAASLLEFALGQPALQVDGLMTIAPLSEDPDVARATFANLRSIRDGLASRFGVPLRELSMGMSGDLEAAVAEGSTQLRIGSALFGPR